MDQLHFNPERLGRRRLPDNKSYRAQLNSKASLVLSALLDLVASNYPKDTNTNLAALYRVLAREIVRQRDSMNLINNDKVYTETRIEYLQQILGERLFLNTKLVPITENDINYRNFLISIKNAYLSGSKKSVIENLISSFTKLKVNLKELYLEARKRDSSYGLIDTHKMIIEIFVNDLLASGMDIVTIKNILEFFINTTKPAHVLYDTKLIWTEEITVNKIHDLDFGDTGGGCTPQYIYTPFNEKTVLALSIVVVGPATVEGPNIYEIGTILPEQSIIYTTDDTKVYVEPGTDGTKLFGSNGKRILFSDLKIGQKIRLTYLIIPGDFSFYYLPPDLSDNYDSRFYKNIFRKPAFQGFVKKKMDSQGRFPLQITATPTTICDRHHQDVLKPIYEDLRKNCDEVKEKPKSYSIALAERMWSPRFSEEGTDTSNERPVLGDLFSFTMPYAPLSNGSGGPATVSDITVVRDGTPLTGAVEFLDASSSYVSLYDTVGYWDTTGGGSLSVTEELRFNYYYLADGTDYPATTSFVYGINFWQLPEAPVTNGTGTNMLALPGDVVVSVDGTIIPGAVKALNALKGIVTLECVSDFWISSPLGRLPTTGDVLKFDYYKSGTKRYVIVFDDPARVMDDYTVFDGPDTLEDPLRVPIAAESPAQTAYKFRADLLHHASVLNSWDTLRLNNYQKPALRASIINRQDTLNHYDYFFSPEFLEDDDSKIVLNDDYLDKDIPPVIILNNGTPPFQKTYSNQPGVIRNLKLQDVRDNHRLLMYCDLLIKEYRTGGNVRLSSICDNSSLNFKIRFNERLKKIEECDPWILFDVAETELKTVTIPGDMEPVKNLRVIDKEIRGDFILREMAPIGTSTNVYVYHEEDEIVNSIYLPATVRKTTVEGEVVDFPSLPVMKDAITFADPSDVTVLVNGIKVDGLIQNLDPVTGLIELYPQGDLNIVEYITLTQQHINQRYVRLSNLPTDDENVALNVLYGPPQAYGLDFVVYKDILFLEYPFRKLLSPGDVLIVKYSSQSLRNRELTFIYNIKSTSEVSVLNVDKSRVFDSDYVFPGYCYDGFLINTRIVRSEYINFLSDKGKGIKYLYVNKDTHQIEEYVFSGPVFESYNPYEDEISAIESFPNALTKITSPLSLSDPLKTLPNYAFLNNDSIRIRKKTIRELMFDRTFRTMEIEEVLPV